MKRYEYFQMRMEPEIAEQLKQLAQDEKESRSSFIRNLIRIAFERRYRLTEQGRAALEEISKQGNGR